VGQIIEISDKMPVHSNTAFSVLSHYRRRKDPDSAHRRSEPDMDVGTANPTRQEDMTKGTSVEYAGGRENCC
jgi:hypothetical protein